MTDETAMSRAASPVALREFLDGHRLDTVLTRDAGVHAALRSTARVLAAAHDRAPSDERVTRAVGADALVRRWEDDVRRARRHLDLFDDAVLLRTAGLARRFVTGRRPLLARRLALGAAVRGHGDLCMRDVHCLPGGSRLRERQGLDERARRLDRLEDAAALAVDLEVAGRVDLGQWFLDRYEEFAAVPAAPPSLRHHYLARRAFVRAVDHAYRSRYDTVAGAHAVRLATVALRHLELAEVRLTLVGGPPGADRSRLAVTLAALTGAELVAAGTTVSAALEVAERALEQGISVVAEATWSADAGRRAATEVARRTASRLVALDCRTTPRTDLAPAGSAEPSEPWPGVAPVDLGQGAGASLVAALRGMSGRRSVDTATDVPEPDRSRAADPGPDGSNGTTDGVAPS